MLSEDSIAGQRLSWRPLQASFGVQLVVPDTLECAIGAGGINYNRDPTQLPPSVSLGSLERLQEVRVEMTPLWATVETGKWVSAEGQRSSWFWAQERSGLGLWRECLGHGCWERSLRYCPKGSYISAVQYTLHNTHTHNTHTHTHILIIQNR